MNKVFIIGRLTKDPEIRATQTGKKVASFSLAVNEGKDSNGQEIVQFFNCSGWDRLAEIVELYVKKGTKVAVIGSLKNRTWDKPDGTKGNATDIQVKELEILSSKLDAAGDQQAGFAGNTTPQANTKPAKSNDNDSDAVPNQELPEISVDDINVQMPF